MAVQEVEGAAVCSSALVHNQLDMDNFLSCLAVLARYCELNSMVKVSSKEVKAIMLACFPACPICNESKGYDVLGADNDYVSCKKCNATWRSADFKNGEKLSKLTLTQPSQDDLGRPLLHRTLSIDFWQNWREKWIIEFVNQAKARSVALLQCKNAILTDKEFRYHSNDEIIDKSWFDIRHDNSNSSRQRCFKHNI